MLKKNKLFGQSPFRIVITFIVLSLLGIGVLPNMSVNLMPDEKPQQLSVSFDLPRSSPQIVEQKVSGVLENAFSQLSALENISSVSRYNRGNITLQFKKSCDLSFKKFELSALIKQVYPRLPKECSYPQISTQNMNGQKTKKPILRYSINAPFLSDKIKQITEQKIKQPLSLIKHISEINIRGANTWQIKVALDLEKMQSYSINKASILNKIKNAQNTHNLGFSADMKNYKIQAEKLEIETLKNLIISHENLKLSDIADIYIEEAPKRQYYRINGLNSVSLEIFSDAGTNQVLLAQTIKKEIEKIKKRLPKNFELFEEYDSTVFIKKELDKIYQRTGLSIIILLLLVLFMKWNFRYMFILLASLVCNISLTLFLVYSFGISVHLYTLTGFTISFGLVVDNMVVMLEHWQKRRNHSVFLALLGASLTSIASLLLIFFLPEQERMNLTEFSQVIALGLGVSLFTAFFFTPALYELIITKKQKTAKKKLQIINETFWRIWEKIIAFCARFKRLFNVLLVLFFGLPVFMLPKQVEGWELYNKYLGNDTYLEYIRPHVDRWLGGTLKWFVEDVFEKSKYRSVTQKNLYIDAEMPFGTTLKEMNSIIMNVEKFIAKFGEVDKFVTSIYSGRHARIEISFKEKYKNSNFPYYLKKQMIFQLKYWGGVNWKIYGIGDFFSKYNGVNNIMDFRVEMEGYNFKTLEQQAARVAKKLKENKRIKEVDIDAQVNFRDKQSQEFQFMIDKAKLAQSFGNSKELMENLQLQSPKLTPDIYIWHNKKLVPVVLESKTSEAYNPYSFMHQVQNSNIYKFKLNNIGTLSFENVSSAIYKRNRQYIRMLAYVYHGSEKMGKKYLKHVLKSTTLPLGYKASLKEKNFSYEKAQRQYGLLFILLLAIFIITSILFENFRKPFLIIFNIPISFIGIFMVFSIYELFFDQGGYASFVLLVGLLANSSIFIIHEFNNLPKEWGNNKRVIQALRNKAFAIVMTIISSALGLVPFLMGGENEVFWYSLAVGSIAGLVFSIFAVFLVLPVWLWKRKENTSLIPLK